MDHEKTLFALVEEHSEAVEPGSRLPHVDETICVVFGIVRNSTPFIRGLKIVVIVISFA